MNEYNLILNEKEILRYLGYKGQEIPLQLRKKILDIRKESKTLFQPKFIYEVYSINKNRNFIEVQGTTLNLLGKDISILLKDSRKCILMAVTLGNTIERRIKFYERIDLTKALILDACATAAVEEICDFIESKLREEYIKEGKTLTYRYSPGYGDLPLYTQKDFISSLNCERRIGLKISEHMLLLPRKSVTAILGIKDGNYIERKPTCSNCNNYNNCLYRREGEIFACKGVY
ncbi:methionine synthase [Clostridium botulinum]|uniref:vitamin B12 dependent-methionine synthase activation domain-containing protein n=1 Tax=Clostridium botulinum TaxID=1491 RepID=UPI00052BBE49|nr:vitamin B12 dependent-methionine synthase activation domain-containing protein [Clostridium botulinum]KGM96810.1 methionine synthase [Clostridium botulinum D str. CCUG 7971]KOC48627.1 methionine synthase [Clostridium botulinum]NFO97984.1 methionine synthase [Clostridium botulinum]OOV50608.1 methionine synthase [Clostridium botulinum D/C]OOV58613.1 methionine synthase [Clostridium botulinum D/C]